MGKMKDEYLKLQETGSLGETGDEDYFYEQYLIQEKMNEEYWEYVSKINYQSEYVPTPDEEEQNFQQRVRENGI